MSETTNETAGVAIARGAYLRITAGLVLEGGAMKGAYTAGVLDFFWMQESTLPNATVLVGACYQQLSFQTKRQTVQRFTDYLEDKNYWGTFFEPVKTGDYFNVQMCYHDIPEHLNHSDYETFDKNPSKGYGRKPT